MQSFRFHVLIAFLILCGGLQSADARALNILLTNDDGFEAPGLDAIRTALNAAGHRVTVVAPRTDQSGSSVKISTASMAFKEESPGVWVVDGSPADAVWVGLERVFPRKTPPDLVISGANRGQNLGAVSNLSGTVGAAVMAVLLEVPAIAVSVGIDFSEAAAGFPATIAAYEGASEFVALLVGRLSERAGSALPAHTVLNVNYPALAATSIKGARWAELGDAFGYSHEYREGESQNTLKLALGQDPNKYAAADASDTARFAAGYITVTALDTSRLTARRTRIDLARRLHALVKP